MSIFKKGEKRGKKVTNFKRRCLCSRESGNISLNSLGSYPVGKVKKR